MKLVIFASTMAITLFAGCGEDEVDPSRVESAQKDTTQEVSDQSKEAETALNIETLKAAVKRFNEHWRFFPPGSIYKLSSGYMVSGVAVMDPNGTNQGIETLVMSLRTRLEGGPFISSDFLQTHQCNTDEDEIADNFANVEGVLKLYEIRDGWGNPFIYVNLAELTPNDRNTPLSIKMADNSIQTVDLSELEAKLMDADTGIQAAKGWCIWSFGKDGINQYGRGDDVTSWHKIEE